MIVVPLTFPLSVGGATAAIVITSASRHDLVPDLLAISAVCLLMAIIVGLTHLLAPGIAGRLSPQNMDILTRISGIALTAIAFQLLARGLTDLAVDAGLRRLLENLVGG